jgi:hypothetical protein
MPGLSDAVSVVLEFFPDEKLTITVYHPMGKQTITGNYRLSFGDTVIFTNLSQCLAGRTTHHQTVIINGDEMILRDSDGTEGIFRRI